MLEQNFITIRKKFFPLAMAGCSELKTESSVIVHCWAKVRLRSSVAFWNAFLNSNAMSSVLKSNELAFPS